MFAPAKIERYYGVTTDFILGYIAIEMEKALKSLYINGFKAFYLVRVARLELTAS